MKPLGACGAQFFVRQSNAALRERALDEAESLAALSTQQQLHTLLRWRLEMVKPYAGGRRSCLGPSLTCLLSEQLQLQPRTQLHWCPELAKPYVGGPLGHHHTKTMRSEQSQPQSRTRLHWCPEWADLLNKLTTAHAPLCICAAHNLLFQQLSGAQSSSDSLPALPCMMHCQQCRLQCL